MAGRDVAKLLVDSRAKKTLSDKSLESLKRVSGITREISQGLGKEVTATLSGNYMLLGIMPDDSGSIYEIGCEDILRKGHNIVLDGLDQQEGLRALVLTRYLHGKVLNPYMPSSMAKRMSRENYQANGSWTPLFRQSIILLGTVVAKAQELEERGAVVNTVSLLITDGEDNNSGDLTAASVAWVVRDMMSSGKHIVAGMGIGETYRKVFREMGIPDRWILTPNDDLGDISNAFQKFMAKAVEASKDPESFRRALESGL